MTNETASNGTLYPFDQFVSELGLETAVAEKLSARYSVREKPYDTLVGMDPQDLADLIGTSKIVASGIINEARNHASEEENALDGLTINMQGGASASASSAASAAVTTDDEDLMLGPEEEDAEESVTGLNASNIGADCDPEAVKYAGQAAMSAVFINMGLYGMVTQDAFWKRVSLPVKCQVRTRISDWRKSTRQLEIGDASEEIAQAVSTMFRPEFKQLLQRLGNMVAISEGAELTGGASRVDITADVKQYAQAGRMALLVSEQLGQWVQDSDLPTFVDDIIQATLELMGIFKDPELHAYLGVVNPRNADAAALAVIKKLSGGGEQGTLAANQVRLALDYERVCNGLADYVARPTKRNFKKVGLRCLNLETDFQMVAVGAGAPEVAQQHPFRRDVDVVRPAQVATAAAQSEAKSWWSFSIDLKFRRS